jgi:primosomal protein N' (replication factor Y)
MTVFYYQVLPTLAVDESFTYKAEEDFAIGQVVSIPFRAKTVLGVIEKKSQVCDIDEKKVKQISAGLSLILSEKQRNFINFVAQYNMVQRGYVLKMSIITAQGLKKEPKLHQAEVKQENFPEFSSEQEAANSYFADKLNAGFSITLLDGVTGSGKTEVYLKAAAEVLKQKGQVLVLLPEIVLTTQLISRFEATLGFAPLQWHSSLTKKNKDIAFYSIINGLSNLLVGARSALFLPFKNLKLIIIDEEHDGSFKQEEGAIYNARDMAIALAKILQIPLILSSATPSAETFYNVKIGKYNTIKLTSRVTKVQFPVVELVDLNKEKLSASTWISKALVAEIHKTVAMKKQTLLFLNRRGYAPFTLCKKCNYKYSCKNCNFFLVYHKNDKSLICHYCGHKELCPKTCKSCGQQSEFAAIGLGIERLEEEVRAKFPELKVMLFASDVFKSRGEIEKALEEINNHNVDIIIGTQIITKGLHFKKLHLVGIIDADSSVLGGDIRALERTYQLLTQVAGRSGREFDQGKVVVQTFSPESILMQHLKEFDRDAFLSCELENREMTNMPPFSRLAIIHLSSNSEMYLLKGVQTLQKVSPYDLPGVVIIGPSPSPIYYMRKQYRYRFVVMAQRDINIQNLLRAWLESGHLSAAVKVKVDIDPYNFL